MILDETTQARVDQILAEAKRQGVDTATLLNRFNLILSPHQRHQIKMEALQSLRASFEQWHPHEYLRRIRHTGSYTPSDMHRAISDYIDDYVKAALEQP